MSVKWSTVDEIRLLKWITTFKPVGINKHFHMICVLERLNNPEKYPVTLLQDDKVRDKIFKSSDIWGKIKEYYDLDKADELEDLLVDSKETCNVTEQSQKDNIFTDFRDHMNVFHEFQLPWDEYGDLILMNARDHHVSINYDNDDFSDIESLENIDQHKPTIKKRGTRSVTKIINKTARPIEKINDKTNQDKPHTLTPETPLATSLAVRTKPVNNEGTNDTPGEETQPMNKKLMKKLQLDNPSASHPPAARTRRKSSGSPVTRRLRNRK